MNQQSYSYESVVLTLERRNKYMETFSKQSKVKEERNCCLAGFLQCNGGKLEEAEDSKCVFVVVCLFESK